MCISHVNKEIKKGLYFHSEEGEKNRYYENGGI